MASVWHLSIFECKNQIDTSFFRDNKLRHKHCRSLLLIQKTHKNWRQFVQNSKIDSIVLVLPHTDVKLSHGIVVVCCWSTTFTQTHKNSEKKTSVFEVCKFNVILLNRKTTYFLDVMYWLTKNTTSRLLSGSPVSLLLMWFSTLIWEEKRPYKTYKQTVAKHRMTSGL